MKLKTIIKAVYDFFFKPQPVYSVVLLRVIFGVIVFLQALAIWENLELFWQPDGLVSMETAVKYGNPLRFNFFELLPNDERVAALLVLLLFLGCLGMIFGFLTKTAIAITFFTLVSFHNRNTFILNSADIVVRNFLFLLFFTPCADFFSFDSWIKKKKGLSPSLINRSPWALRLIQIQFCVIYIATVFFKMKGPMWADGTAIYFATRLEEFVRMPLSILNDLATIKFLTWSTLIIEFALGTLVWIRELRYWVLLAGIGLHLGIEMTMHIPLFEWIMIGAMACMIDPNHIGMIIDKIKIFKLAPKSSIALD